MRIDSPTNRNPSPPKATDPPPIDQVDGKKAQASPLAKSVIASPAPVPERDGVVMTMPALGSSERSPRLEPLTPVSLIRRFTTVFANSCRLSFDLFSRVVMPNRSNLDRDLDPLMPPAEKPGDPSLASGRAVYEDTQQSTRTERLAGVEQRTRTTETRVVEASERGIERVRSVRVDEQTRSDPPTPREEPGD